MAEKTEKKRKYKDLSDAEKYKFWKEGLKKTGILVLGSTVAIGIGAVIYNIGKNAGTYDCLEYIHNQFPECSDTIKAVDPAFFTTLKK